MSEVWKPVPKFSAYEVSNLGRIRRVRDYDSRGPRHLLPYVLSVKANGRVRLRSDNFRTREVELARLVAQVFVPTSKTGLILGYRDGDPTNRRADNLGWAFRPSPRWFPRRPRFWDKVGWSVDNSTTEAEN